MRKLSLILMLALLISMMSACTMPWNEKSDGYTQISYEEAKKMMDEQEDIIILDVRTEKEFKGGYIKGAILFPSQEVNEETAAEKLPDKDQTILIYCSSGGRSKKVAQQLADMGYTSLYEFGGINSWPYEIYYDVEE